MCKTCKLPIHDLFIYLFIIFAALMDACSYNLEDWLIISAIFPNMEGEEIQRKIVENCTDWCWNSVFSETGGPFGVT